MNHPAKNGVGHCQPHCSPELRRDDFHSFGDDNSNMALDRAQNTSTPSTIHLSIWNCWMPGSNRPGHYEVYLLTSKGSKVLHADCEVHVIGGWWCWVCLDITCKQETSKMRNKDGILFLPLFFLEERSVSQTFMHWITMEHTVAGYLIYIYM
jgi:hypothetical protein